MSNKSGKKRKLITLDEKRVMIQRIGSGEKQTDVAKEYGLSKQSINSIWTNREKIMAACETTGKGVSRIHNKRHRHPVMDEVEKLLLLWIEDMQMRGDPLSGEHICSKARQIYEEIIKDYPGESCDYDHEEEEEEKRKGFRASNGWFYRFLKRTGIRTDKMTGEEGDLLPIIACQCVLDDDDGEDNKEMLAEIVATARNLNMDVDEEDLTELVEENAEHLSVEDLREMAAMKENEEQGLPKTQQEVPIKTADIEQFLKGWERVQDFSMKHHPKKLEVKQVLDAVDDLCGGYFRSLMKSRKMKQTNIKNFFSPPRAGPSGATPTGPSAGAQAGPSRDQNLFKRHVGNDSD
ncbi:unnamed protein product [Notodromas monacha]|uniref:HTH CENPB-type domain-containing protein n=1 Tax=Notodromas monacha TaxID=399045 RepID=A0A7R9BJM3_9CRUS|nr:unnamed protein product [Notodromas monacha]CAG0915321.1 unnamed protein product [Notodromas monacha]